MERQRIGLGLGRLADCASQPAPRNIFGGHHPAVPRGCCSATVHHRPGDTDVQPMSGVFACGGGVGIYPLQDDRSLIASSCSTEKAAILTIADWADLSVSGAAYADSGVGAHERV